MTQLGVTVFEIPFPGATKTNPYPDLPLEIDDEHITADQIYEQPQGTLSLMAGFNKGAAVYDTMGPVASVEFAQGIQQLPWREQKKLLDSCLQAAKDVTLNMPAELFLDLDSQGLAGAEAAPAAMALGQTEYFDDLPGYKYYPPGTDSIPDNDLRLVLEGQPERRRRVQFDIQKANIYVSQLATRSYYVELYFNLRDAARAKSGHGLSSNGGSADAESAHAESALAEAALAAAEDEDGIDSKMEGERERIVQSLMLMLGAIPQRNMEPNGSALVNKIRQVASTLVRDPSERKGPLALRADQYLKRFVEFLMQMERSAGAAAAGIDGPAPDVAEEEGLRIWADLREEQQKFALQGGFLGS
jgi:hypothetical protein